MNLCRKELIAVFMSPTIGRGRLLSALYLLNEWMDFGQTYINLSLGGEKMLIRFWWPWPHFQGHVRT